LDSPLPRATPLHSVALRAANISLEKHLAETSRPSWQPS